jgi:hypothetical protein
MAFKLYIDELTFSDGTKVRLNESSFLVIVGPNNAGKSVALREIQTQVAADFVPRVVPSLSIKREGTAAEAWEHIKATGNRLRGHSTEIYMVKDRGYTQPDANDLATGLGKLGDRAEMFISMLNATERVKASATTRAIEHAEAARTHPLHVLYEDRSLRAKLEKWFRAAFGTEIGMDLMAGQRVPLHVGAGASPRPEESEIDQSYLERLRNLPKLDDQGDGMRSFVGTLLYALLLNRTIFLVDEPEAFLHPPQARLLGRLLGTERVDNAQLFVATHSADFMRGVLESGDPEVRVIRLQREGSINHVKELTPDQIQAVWADPVLRYSNILEGLFHEKVVICEADGDCRFYGAIADALRSTPDHDFIRDVMFVQSGGKGGIPKVIKALRSLDVPIAAVTDFDILRSTGQLWAIVEALGGNRSRFVEDYNIVKRDIEALGKTQVSVAKQKIAEIMSNVDDTADEFPAAAQKQIGQLLKTPVGWKRAKETGLNIVSRGEAYAAAERLLGGFAELGLFVAPVGELEAFVRSETTDKNEWVNSVLETFRGTLATSPDLVEARSFVEGFIRSPRAKEAIS